MAFFVAVAGVYTMVPLAVRAAARLQFYDRPAGESHKGHAAPTPYLGGTALLAGLVVAVLVASAGHWDQTLPLLGGMAVLWVVGTVDDRRGVSPGVRVA